MSKQNNVNPDHYKTRGRERPGKDVVTDVLKQNYSEAKSREARRDLKKKDRELKKSIGRVAG